MAKSSPKKKTARPAARAPEIYTATLGTMGEVAKGTQITLAQAILERQSGRDVVVCGPTLGANMLLAQQIEGSVTGGRFVFHAAHASAGPHALAHFQPRVRPPHGHTFFESPPHRTAR